MKEHDQEQIMIRTTAIHKRRLQEVALRLDMTLQAVVIQATTEFLDKIDDEESSGEIFNGTQITVPSKLAKMLLAVAAIFTTPLDRFDKIAQETIKRFADVYIERVNETKKKKNGTNG